MTRPATPNRIRRLHALYAAIRQDTLYRSDSMGKVFVPGAGWEESPLVFVGEAPGRSEELEGRPFVGAAGRNLEGLLKGIGWSRERVFITNLVKYRPLTASGGNRKPTRRERAAALPYLLRELDILKPEVVVCLGNSPAEALLRTAPIAMAAANGKLFAVGALQLFVTYHPSPLNTANPERKRALCQAFRELHKLVEGIGAVT
jgi:DNA polymerase